MRLASFAHEGRQSYGAVLPGDRIVDLGRRLGEGFPTLRTLLAGGLGEARHLAQGHGDLSVDEIDWLPVIPQPDKILCVGLNYRAHIEEIGRPIEDHPVIFLRLASSQVGAGRPIIRPRASEQLDFEGELAVVIGTGGRHIRKAEALAHVAGYTIYNDASVRDWQRHTHQYTPGKNFPATGACGPWLVTADEIPDPNALTLTTRLNDAIVQRSGIDDLMFKIDELIAYVSTFAELLPGDVIVTGTPGGVGAARKPPLWMKPGDVVEVEIGRIGVLRNPVAAEE